jgi:hypothetical protein
MRPLWFGSEIDSEEKINSINCDDSGGSAKCVVNPGYHSSGSAEIQFREENDGVTLGESFIVSKLGEVKVKDLHT